MYVYQIQNVQVIFQYKALHGPLEICKYSQSLGRGEGGGKGGSTKLSGAVPLLCICKDIGGYAVVIVKAKVVKLILLACTHNEMT